MKISLSKKAKNIFVSKYTFCCED